MVTLRLACLLCIHLCSVEIWGTPTTSGFSHHNSDENGVIPNSVQFNPSHIVNYPGVPRSESDHGSRHDSSHASALNKNESKRVGAIKTTRIRRTPIGFSARGFHEEAFDRDFGHFSPVKRSEFDKRRPEADAAGFYGDTFSNGFGEFETMKRRYQQSPLAGLKGIEKSEIDPRYLSQRLLLEAAKRSPEMTKSGFHSDVFNGGFGEFHPMRK